MSLELYQWRFDQEVKYLDSLSDFLTLIKNDPHYSVQMSDIYAQEVVVPYLRDIMDDLGDEAQYRQFIRNVGDDERTMQASLWEDLMSRMRKYLRKVEFSYKVYYFEKATVSKIWKKALVENTQIVSDIYTTLCGNSEPSMRDMRRQLRKFATSNNAGIMMHHILNHEDEGVVKYCGKFVRDAVQQDMHSQDDRSILDNWVDEGLVGSIGRDALDWFDTRHEIDRRLSHNPVAQATARSMVKKDALQPEYVGDHNREHYISLLEMILPDGRNIAARICRSPGQVFDLKDNHDF